MGVGYWKVGKRNRREQLLVRTELWRMKESFGRDVLLGFGREIISQRFFLWAIYFFNDKKNNRLTEESRKIQNRFPPSPILSLSLSLPLPPLSFHPLLPFSRGKFFSVRGREGGILCTISRKYKVGTWLSKKPTYEQLCVKQLIFIGNRGIFLPPQTLLPPSHFVLLPLLFFT